MSNSDTSRQVTVLVPGLWTPAFLLLPLLKKLSRHGHRVHRFPLSARRYTPAENARRLALWLDSIDADVVHLVGHSLGGVVLLHLFEQGYSHRGDDRACVILLACPAQGSRLARQLVNGKCARLWRFLLGRSIERGLLGDVPAWDSAVCLRVVAGTRQAGIASVIFPQPGIGDGVVGLEEARVDGYQDLQQMPVSHAGFLFSDKISRLLLAHLADLRLSGLKTPET